MFSITPRTRRSFRSRAVLGAVVAAVALGCAPGALAGNTYRAASFTCEYPGGGVYTSGNVIRVNVPFMTSIVGSLGLANISFRATIYRYTNGRWVHYARSAWIDGAANGATSGGGWTRNFALFQNVPAGSYSAYNEFFWESNGARAGAWSPYAGGNSYYCTF